MSNPSPKTEHLGSTKWKKGQSGNPAGKPKGSINLSSWIKRALEDSTSGMYKLQSGQLPVEAMVAAMISKAIDGDVRAFEVLAKHGFGNKLDITHHELPRPILSGLSQLPSRNIEELVRPTNNLPEV